MACLLERILLPVRTSNIILRHFQHGFRKKHSNTTALSVLTQAVLSGFNQKGTPTRTAAVALHLKRAFDSVNLNLLTEAMLKFKIPNSIKKWFSGYLTGRDKKTNFDKIMTRTEKLRSGVHHGVVFSPFVCCWYLKGMSEPCNFEVVCCADDITVYCSHLYYKEAVKTSLATLMIVKPSFTEYNCFPRPRSPLPFYCPSPIQTGKKIWILFWVRRG